MVICVECVLVEADEYLTQIDRFPVISLGSILNWHDSLTKSLWIIMI